jgi:hypothetical protein
MVESSQPDNNVRFRATFFHIVDKPRESIEDVEKSDGCGSACTGSYEENPRLHLVGGVQRPILNVKETTCPFDLSP